MTTRYYCECMDFEHYEVINLSIEDYKRILGLEVYVYSKSCVVERDMEVVEESSEYVLVRKKNAKT